MRTICYNIYMCRGWPQEASSRESTSIVIPDLLAKSLENYKLDVITFSEVPTDSIMQAIAEHLGMQMIIFQSPEKYHGALLTRFEVLESKNCSLQSGKRPENLFTRHWGRAVLYTGKEELIVHSVHLFPDAQSSIHAKEVEEVIEVIQKDIKSGCSILLQGDLNHEPDDPAYERWIEAGLVDTFGAAGVGPGETYKADQPVQRIDYIFAYGPILQRILECRVLSDVPFKVDTSVSKHWCLSDHLPVMATFYEHGDIFHTTWSSIGGRGDI